MHLFHKYFNKKFKYCLDIPTATPVGAEHNVCSRENFSTALIIEIFKTKSILLSAILFYI